MKILVVAATSKEIMPVLDYYSVHPTNGLLKSNSTTTPDFLITGVGAIATTYHLTKVLSENTYDLVLNLGICGAYPRTVPIGQTFLIKRDCFADIGAEDGDDFILLTQLNNVYSDTIGWLYPLAEIQTELPKATSITVNTVTGNERSKNRWKDYYNPDIESMEGAAFFYTCLKEKAPSIQLRTVSNYVGNRQEACWNIDVALEKLNNDALHVLRNL